MCSAEMQASIRRWRWRMRVLRAPGVRAAVFVGVFGRTPVSAPAASPGCAPVRQLLDRAQVYPHNSAAHEHNPQNMKPIGARAAGSSSCRRCCSCSSSSSFRSSSPSRSASPTRPRAYRRSRTYLPGRPTTTCSLALSLGNYQVPAHRRGLWRRLPLFAAHRLFLDPDLPAARLSDGLRHRAHAQSRRRTCCC